ncbi:MAG: RNA 2',3'-cyclic phosphodiesterase [Alphaproteobacteria bacterium PA4]|nr:MAG: RNA 2',3'-cyclic phosphodiesterase [Alphaproteobacteria bacterium PA4]
MIRLFVALELPPAIRDGLLAAMGGVAGARWQHDAQLHLTLRFIGEVDRHLAQDIAAALASVNIQPFSLSLTTPGTFDRKGRIDNLWVGVTPQQDVAMLARRIDQALVRVGVPPLGRAFVPHVTVARFGRTVGDLSGFPLRPLPIAPFMVNGFALFESRVSHHGSEYNILAHYRAGAGG